MAQPVFSLDDIERALINQMRTYAATLKTIRQAKKATVGCTALKTELNEITERERALLEARVPKPLAEPDNAINDLMANRGHWVYPNSY